MRLFFALETDEPTTLAISHWRDTQLTCDGRPVPLANFHVTLAFVGKLSHEKSKPLADTVDLWLSDVQPAGDTLQLNCPGYWPKVGIFWLGPEHWPDSLTAISRKLRSIGVATGARRESQTFRPHVSLYRGCQLPPPAPIGAPAISWRYRHFSLMESIQGKSGVRYRPLASWELL